MADQFLTDDVVLARLGERLAQVRLGRDQTQRQLADEAGVGKTVVERVENGKSITLANFVRVLRALDRLDELMLVAPEPTLRPAELAQRSGQRRQRASRTRARMQGPKRSGSFAWGDQRDVPAGADSSSGAERSGGDRPRDALGRPGGDPSRQASGDSGPER